MSYLDRIVEANDHDTDAFVPLEIDGLRLGHVRPAFAEKLARWPEVFEIDEHRVRLAHALRRGDADPGLRTEAVAPVLEALRVQGLIRGWRDELFPINESWSDPAALLVERAAIPHLGAGGYGVHLNGFVRRADGLHMWIARRAFDKPTWPGLLDQMAAGGQPAGLGLRENMLKECREEAGVPPELAARMRPVGVVSYVLETAEGLRPDVIYGYDLELPDDFGPHNADGEVEDFRLLPIAEVARLVRETREFKFNCALVVIDFLVRHGVLEESEPGYVQIVEGLHAAPSRRR
jgi:8-oxo-dGTP pyrophosphatase MutT (NUDIX family)